MSPQEIFNIVVQHLISQGKRATDTSGTCQYHAPNGTKCAVGCLIPDNYYTTEMEGCTAYEISEYLPKNLQDNIELISGLQSIHDIQSNWNSVGLTYSAMFRLEELAKKFSLSIEIIEQHLSPKVPQS